MKTRLVLALALVLASLPPALHAADARPKSKPDDQPKTSTKAERAAVKHLLAEPRQVRHTASSPAHLCVEWDDVAMDEAGYRIWRREAGGAWYLAGETGPDATHFDDGGMQELTAYEQKVAAFNATGEATTAATPGSTKTPRMEPHLMPEVIVSAGRSSSVTADDFWNRCRAPRE